MPFITSETATRETYDVIVVGSGAGGGQTAYTLTMDGARVLAYSGDTCPCPGLVEAARGADLLVCEATLSDEGEGTVRGHLTLAEAQTARAEAGARRLLVTHRPAELPGSGVELASDGLVVEL